MKAVLVSFVGLVLLTGVAQAEYRKKTTTTIVEESGGPATTGTILSAPKGSAKCDDLYDQRNQIFKDAGLCFTRKSAIQRLGGNAGCQYDKAAEVPISANDRATVKRIVAQERALGCPRKP